MSTQLSIEESIHDTPRVPSDLNFNQPRILNPHANDEDCFFDSEPGPALNARFREAPALRAPAPFPFKSESLTKWNLTFAGETCVREFFSRVEEEGVARSISPSYVVRRFHELLTGSALKYFRTIRSPALTYYDLKTAFLKTFDVSDYDFKVESQLRALAQRPNQSVVDFVIQARDLNSKLRTPVPEEVLFNIVKYGMHPRFHPCLATNIVNDIDGLLEIAKNFEAFQSSRTSRLAIAPVNSSESGEVVGLVCMKCNTRGHNYRNCPNISEAVCFQCRRVGVITRECPNCSPGMSKNVPRAH